MTYIAFVGYNESDFKDFKIGNHSVSICKKEDFPDPSDYILRHAQKLGVDGEKCVENIMNKIIKNPLFKDFELIPTHQTPHSGDFLFMNKKRSICFMLECKNKQNISFNDDLQKFLTDIDNVSKVYNIKTYGVFLQLGNNKISNHDCIELNENTIYLTKDYIHKSCLEIIFTHYCKLSSMYSSGNTDMSFIEQCLKDLNNIIENNKKEKALLAKVISRCERNIKSINKAFNNLDIQNGIVEKILDLYQKYKANKQNTVDDDSMDSLNSLEGNKDDDDDIFNLPTNEDSKSCVNLRSKNNNKNKLFAQMRSDKVVVSNITKRLLTKNYPQYIVYINTTNVADIKKEYRLSLQNK